MISTPLSLEAPFDQHTPPSHSAAHSCLSLSPPSHCAPCSPTHCPQPTTVPLSLPPPNPTQPRLTVRAASPRMAVRLRPVTLRTMIDPPPTTPRVSTFSVSLAPTLTRGPCSTCRPWRTACDHQVGRAARGAPRKRASRATSQCSRGRLPLTGQNAR